MKKINEMNKLREKLGLFNIQAIAKRTNVHPNTIYGFKKGKKGLSAENYIKISNYIESVVNHG